MGGHERALTETTADHSRLHARHRDRGVNPLVYWLVRAVFQPFFHLYFRLSRIGREHVPESGPVIFAANHRSFLDPFVIATIARRPMYYVAKEELFRDRLTAWFLNSLGAFAVSSMSPSPWPRRTGKAPSELRNQAVSRPRNSSSLAT